MNRSLRRRSRNGDDRSRYPRLWLLEFLKDVVSDPGKAHELVVLIRVATRAAAVLLLLLLLLLLFVLVFVFLVIQSNDHVVWIVPSVLGALGIGGVTVLRRRLRR